MTKIAVNLCAIIENICVICGLSYLCPMNQNTDKTVLILGANSDVAKQAAKQYVEKGFSVIAASRNTKSLEQFVSENNLNSK
jgi:glutamyl-tRNA reductase